MFGIPCPSAVEVDAFEHKTYHFKEKKNLSVRYEFLSNLKH